MFNGLITMKKITQYIIIAISLVSITSSTNAGNYKINNENLAIKNELVINFINEFAKEKIYTKKELNKIFSNTVIRKKKIIKAQNNQAEKTLTWKNYKNIVVTKTRINAGKVFLYKYSNLLDKVEKEFKVDKEVITAILGVETNYGFKKGDYKAIDSLTTLSFEYYPRGKFFKNELKEFLKYSKKNNINPLSVKSSWAGAIGYPQFIPSSINSYGIDYDKDGKIDLVNSVEDSVASVANYLRKNGFVFNKFYYDKINIKTNIKISTGLKLDKDCSIIKLNNKYCNDKFKIFKLDDETYIGSKNFYSITMYNRSNLYAAAVLEIAKSLKN